VNGAFNKLKKTREMFWSGRRDLNSGPPAPKAVVLTSLNYAPAYPNRQRTAEKRVWISNDRSARVDLSEL
jgi:hypothetical protein